MGGHLEFEFLLPDFLLEKVFQNKYEWKKVKGSH